MSIEVLIFYLLLIDATGANIFAFSGARNWYTQNFRLISRWFPLGKGWTLYYLILVLWVGSLLYRSGALF